jgi:hypothetical protein
MLKMVTPTQKKPYTAAEFDEIANLQENADRFCNSSEEIVEAPSNAYASKIGGIIFGELYIFLKGKDVGH